MVQVSERQNFVSHREAARLAGLHPRTVERRIKAAGIPTFRGSVDLRERLIRREDFEQMLSVQPLGDRRTAAVMAA